MTLQDWWESLSGVERQVVRERVESNRVDGILLDLTVAKGLEDGPVVIADKQSGIAASDVGAALREFVQAQSSE